MSSYRCFGSLPPKIVPSAAGDHTRNESTNLKWEIRHREKKSDIAARPPRNSRDHTLSSFKSEGRHSSYDTTHQNKVDMNPTSVLRDGCQVNETFQSGAQRR